MNFNLSPFYQRSDGPHRARRPIAARITLGRQPPDRLGRAYPIAKDRVWICSPIADGEQVQGRSGSYTQRFLPLHPDFDRWNHDPFLRIEQWDDSTYGAMLARIARGEEVETGIREAGGDQMQAHLRAAAMMRQALAQIPEAHRRTWRDAMEAHRKSRRVLRGVLVHRSFLLSPPTDDDAAWLRYAAQGAKEMRGERLIPHPQKLPSCISSDGIHAHRWDGRSYVERECRADRCPFRAEGSAERGPGAACGKTISVVFQLRWPDLCWRCNGRSSACPECSGTGTAPAMPSALVEVEASGTFNFAALAFTTFIEDVDRQWRALDLPGEPDYVGLPFVMQMQHKVGGGKDYWTLHVAPDFPAGTTFQEWAFGRAKMRAAGRALMVGSVPLIEDGQGAAQSYVETRIRPSSIPGEVVDG